MTFAPRTFVVGEVVSAAIMNQEIRDQFNSMFAAWTAYTPTWTSSSTNPVLGNGTLTGRHMKIGRTCLCHINLTTGSTTTYGTGNYSFSLPFTSANTGSTIIGNAQLLGTDRWAGHMLIGNSASTTSPFFSSSSTNPRLGWMSPTLPETLAAGAQVRMTFLYETAA
ncbi:hypothetical protein ABT063_02000 [Streptomyces sp. NPDC002838]|uniref:hypothetical protein n=1 Tax=Streptomyces sp. NPDC002838 TaxID=3154436 RepID=UPI00332A370C